MRPARPGPDSHSLVRAFLSSESGASFDLALSRSHVRSATWGALEFVVPRYSRTVRLSGLGASRAPPSQPDVHSKSRTMWMSSGSRSYSSLFTSNVGRKPRLR